MQEQNFTQRLDKTSNNIFRYVFEQAEEGIVILHSIFENEKIVDFKILAVNPSATKILSKPETDFLGNTLLKTFPGVKEAGLFDHYCTTAFTGETFLEEIFYPFESYDKWFQIKAVKIPEGIVLHFIDITTHKVSNVQLEKTKEELLKINQQLDQLVRERTEALAISEERHRFMSESIPSIVWTANPDGRLDYYNQKWMDYTGLTLEETYSTGWETVMHPEDLQLTTKKWRIAVQQGHNYRIEHRVKGRDGNYRWFVTRAIPLKDKSGRIIKWFGTAVDIHDERMITESLKESEEKYRFVIETIPQLVWTTDANGNVAFFNKHWFEYTGQNPENAKEWGWTKVLHPDHSKTTIEAWSESLKTGNPYYIEYKLKKHDGTYRWFLAQGLPMKDKHGNIIKWFGTCTDIHTQKEFQDQLNKKNLELQKINNDLDTFIYTASHDLKAPISNLEGLLNAFTEENEYKQEQQLLIDMMYTSIERFRRTIKDLTEIGKIQRFAQEDPERLLFSDVLSDVELDIRELIEKFNPVIETHFQVPAINYSKKNLRSIIYNLLSNALKYSSREREVRIKVSTKKQDSYTLLEVTDNGLGLSEDNQKKIFGMFKRVHQHIEGTGIGLYMIKRLIENTGGKIKLESEEGKGTTFKVYFPS